MKDVIARIRGLYFALWCRCLGRKIKIGRGLMVYKKLRIYGEGSVEIGSNCIIAGIIGDDSQYVTIDTQARNATVKIGDNVKLSAARISAKYAISIGNDVLIEESGVVDTDFHSIKRDRDSELLETSDKCKIIIGNGVSVGARSFVSKGVSIGDNVIAAPGSIIMTSIKPGLRICGNPARPM